MLDIIALTLNSSQYKITHPEKFSPSADWITKPGAWYGIRSKQNPSYKERAREICKPKLTLSCHKNTQGHKDIFLRIETSLPKLFYGNNIQELRYKNFIPCMEKLRDFLKGMGVSVEILKHSIAENTFRTIFRTFTYILLTSLQNDACLDYLQIDQ